MRIVFDASVALKTVLPESDSARAEQIRDDFRAGAIELLAPDVFPVEIGHSLAKAERQGRISSPDGWLLWQSIMVDVPRLVSSLSLMPRAWAIASAARISLYDCLYVALAEHDRCQLVTADTRLINALGSSFPFILDLASFP